MCNSKRTVQKFRSLREAMRAATALGATVEQDDTAINLDAPTGKVWAATGSHTITIPTEIWRAARKAADLTADIASDLSYGFCDCVENECEVCGEKGGR